MKQYVVGLGEVLWDVLPEGKKLGGAPANFAYHAGQFGLDTLAVSALGEDALAEETIQALRENGLHYLLPRVAFPTGTVQVTLSGDVRLKSIRSRFVHSAFERAGTLETSDATFAALQSATERSYLSNFTGIPTDCPHREKNGWTGDAQLAMETGLWNYDAKDSYVHFLRMMLDAQRPNGAVPCILPCSTKFGFFWGSGPAWDAILFEIPWQLYRFYGDDKPARAAYPAMKLYIAFIEGKADGNGLYDYGLGDWCPPKGLKKTPTRLTDSAYVYEFNRRAAFWAERFGETEYAVERAAAAERIKAAFNAAFYKGDGLYDEGQLAALAAPLYFKGLCADGEDEKVAKRLVDEVRANAHKAHFGILGAKWATRVLVDYGYYRSEEYLSNDSGIHIKRPRELLNVK